MSPRRHAWALLLAALGVASCADAPPPVSPPPPPVDHGEAPPGWDDGIRPPEAEDLNPDPSIVEVALDARVASLEILPGTTTPAWTYNGGLCGPLIRAKVGDTIIVHFTNSLPEETTVHWHGIRLPSAMDGVPGHTQAPVPPGGSFDYVFQVPDAGLFWYHPHSHSAVQVGFGLYGPLLVEDPTEPADLGQTVVMVLSDIAVDPDGSLSDPDRSGDLGKLFGREGNVLLVNGRVHPNLVARPGARQRWRIVDAAISRYFQLALDGKSFTQIGSDGGFIEAPTGLGRPVVSPGERMDLLVDPSGDPGSAVTVRWTAFDRGFGTAFDVPDQDLFTVTTADVPPFAPPPLPDRLRTIPPLDLTNATQRLLQLTFDQSTGSLVMGINGVPAWDAPPWDARVGDTEVWTISNAVPFAHPFHLHGFFFQPLDALGAPLGSPYWQDTINVPVDGTIRFAVRYDDRPGMWMFHCHILDHADAGMMGMLMLSP
jgi:FtsP/CotA-like multicopper oxidase with cupredoxin domain